MNSKINPAVLQAKIRELDTNIQKGITRLHVKPHLKVMKQPGLKQLMQI